jgi:hypothetical protein
MRSALLVAAIGIFTGLALYLGSGVPPDIVPRPAAETGPILVRAPILVPGPTTVPNPRDLPIGSP